MKKILYILFAAMFALCSCTEEIDLQDTVGKECITLTVFNSPMTKADAGPDYERNLTHLDVFFYVKGQTDSPCVYYQRVTDSKYLTGAAEIPFYVVEEQINAIFPNGNTCDVLVIANLPDGIRPVLSDGDKATFGTGEQGTDYNRLTALLLERGKGYDDIGQNFIMAGFDGNVRKDGNNNASGTVKLVRAASKITVTINIPEKIVLPGADGAEDVTMVPVLTDDQELVPFQTGFHNGVKYGYVYPAGMVDNDMSVITDEWYFETEKSGYTKVKDIPADASGIKKYQYTCEVPFYSYSSSWQKGDERAAYLTLEIPWKREGENLYHAYYYHILVNAGGRRLDPNHWYDLYVNVGVIGSTVESTPVELDDMTVYVLDWTTEPDPEDTAGGDRYEDVEMEQYTYLNVPNKRIEMNNTPTGTISFDASHKVKWALEWPDDEDIISTFDEMEREFNNKQGYRFSAYYVNCKPSNGSTTPIAVTLANFIDSEDFSLSQSGQSLTFNYHKEDVTYKIFSPIYVHLKLWLDIDGTGNQPNGDEVNFVEYVTFVYYPAMYILPELSVTQSVYVNGNRASRNNDDDEIYINGTTYDLGGAYGQDNSKYMHIISVSSFAENDKFTLDGNSVSYIIGDPRVRKSDIHLNNDGYDMSKNNTNGNGWVLDAAGRELEYYYPTSTDIEFARVISPKFRISSKLGGYSNGDREGTTMRCASYQENGYPAGRWRVPTTAEVAFIAYLQSQDVIQDLFVDKYYFSATHLVKEGANGADVTTMDNNDRSVRCVYDDWYWGSEQEAIVNTGTAETEGNHFLYTWGDKQIWDDNGNPL